MGGLAPDHWIIFLPAVEYILRLKHLQPGSQHPAPRGAVLAVGGRGWGGHSGTQQLSSHVPLHEEPA